MHFLWKKGGKLMSIRKNPSRIEEIHLKHIILLDILPSHIMKNPKKVHSSQSEQPLFSVMILGLAVTKIANLLFSRKILGISWTQTRSAPNLNSDNS